MAILDFTRSASRSVTIVDRFHTLISKLLADFHVWNDTRRTNKILSRLSAQELDDIGLTRGDIDVILRKGRL